MTATGDLTQVSYPRSAERQQRAVFDEPGPANVQSGVDLVQDAERADLVEDKALAELEAAPPALRKVLETQGRHTSDRLAAEQQWRRDQIDASATVRDAAPGWAARHQAHERAQRARARIADTRPRAGDFPGTGRQRDQHDHAAWMRHFTGRYPDTFDVDDLQRDAELDEIAAGFPPEDVHDLDDDDAMEDVR